MQTGSARVPSDAQDTTAQVPTLTVAGCERVFRENAFFARSDRPKRCRVIDQLREGGVVVVWRLDRLSHSLRNFLIPLERLVKAKPDFAV